MGVSKEQQVAKDNLLLPHMELIQQYNTEDDDYEEQVLGVDDEQDEDEVYFECTILTYYYLQLLKP